jgi:hypothetical protein
MSSVFNRPRDASAHIEATVPPYGTGNRKSRQPTMPCLNHRASPRHYATRRLERDFQCGPFKA